MHRCDTRLLRLPGANVIDPAFIIEPPKDGWPEITPEAMRLLGKAEEVTQLLRRLPYIKDRPYSQHPEGLPGVSFIDWPYEPQSEEHAGNILLVSKGTEEESDGKIPSYYIGLVHGGLLMGNEERDVILLDTTSGVMYYMNCPVQIKETA